ncbi:hypothetical protein TSAR_002070, partial [Trichomalopsis sarcophagae]
VINKSVLLIKCSPIQSRNLKKSLKSCKTANSINSNRISKHKIFRETFRISEIFVLVRPVKACGDVSEEADIYTSSTWCGVIQIKWWNARGRAVSQDLKPLQLHSDEYTSSSKLRMSILSSILHTRLASIV